MATVVSFHAHPDDEAIACGGTLARLAREGHRVVVVTATKGELGEVAEGFLEPGENLGERRAAELREAAIILGVQRVEVLEYRDSGMAGTAGNDAAGSFWRADVEQAAERVAAVLRDERADVLTVYDARGGYDHPDHVQVHRVGVRAAELAGTPVVYEATVPRSHAARLAAALEEQGITVAVVDASFGVPDELITTVVDVRPVLDVKRRAIKAHASQVPDSGWILKLPRDLFEAAFGHEWFIRRGAPPGTREEMLAGVDGGRGLR